MKDQYENDLINVEIRIKYSVLIIQFCNVFAINLKLAIYISMLS